jgi:uncharacterized phage-associated protein
MDRDKFAELMLHIARRSVDDPHFGATKLAKILYFSDFNAYRLLGQSITSATYHKYSEGPVPTALPGIRNALIEAGDAKIENRATFAGVQNRLVALRRPDLSHFDAAQIALVDEVIDELRPLTGQGVSDLSHQEFGWLSSYEHEEIPYGTAWVGSEPLTGEQIDLCIMLVDQPDLVGSA